MISSELLTLLVCPQSQQRLSEGTAELLTRINRAVTAGRLKYHCGRPVEQPLDGVLVREDQALAYPVLDGIPVMLVDQSIELAQLDSAAG